MKLKSARIVMLLVLLLIGFPQQSKAGILTGTKFLTWERTNQEFYIETSIGMVGLIVTRNNKTQAQCLENWYLANQSAKNDFIIETMRQHSEFHPRGTILAVLEKQCGSFTYKR